MFENGTEYKELSSVLKADSSGEAVRGYQRQLLCSLEKLEKLPRGAINDTSTKALQAASALLPILWRDLNRR